MAPIRKPKPADALREYIAEANEQKGATPWLEPSAVDRRAQAVLAAMEAISVPGYAPPDPERLAELTFKRLTMSEERVEFQDLGSGSKGSTKQSMRTRSTKLGAFAKRSASRLWVRRLLYEMVVQIDPRRVLELGTAAGASAASMATALSILPRPDHGMPRMVTVEGSNELAQAAQRLLNDLGVAHECLVVCSSFEPFYEDHLAEAGHEIDLAFVDGLHTPSFMRESLRAFLRSCMPGTVLVYDDLAWSGETREAWHEMESLVSSHGGRSADLETLGVLILGEG